MKIISNESAYSAFLKGDAVIIDVREQAEFKDSHLPGAINFPFTKYQKAYFEPFNDKQICLICQSGRRAKAILEKLKEDGFSNLAIMEKQMENVSEHKQSHGWTIDRQFRMTLGTLMLIFLLGYFNASEYFIIIPIILCTGLIFTSIIDRCYMRMGIALLPWNRGKNG
ncbi:hypothetical protein EGI22_11110 [Lacihabitans sp. LS3-19]|uniref:rhodanese-like domain-containing protein n=1 Tax=Lacihabitans sp. LS3-19 TaxID=2487335 RepID=UPI0020CBC90E|nr:rhodanese-like domain-containing protein [Lacihabitans sp. LS3-19]MCP9768463.1 hypothetical protein [Lacihabitans sp. LS3-19]